VELGEDLVGRLVREKGWQSWFELWQNRLIVW
jgi:hypothetical protein